jgi:hypothetical protein
VSFTGKKQNVTQNPIIITMKHEEVQKQSGIHHAEEVYWDVPMDDVAYL